MDDQSFCTMKLNKVKYTANRKWEIKTRAEINEIGHGTTRKKINETKTWYFEKIKKNSIYKKKREDTI